MFLLFYTAVFFFFCFFPLLCSPVLSPAPKPASTKPGSVASPKPDKPPVSKTTR